ncbi:MAG: hypothetical protein R2991_10905 [Thermoanaerobaculia bacterium]
MSSRRVVAVAVLLFVLGVPRLQAALPEVPDRFTVTGDGTLEVRGVTVPVLDFEGELLVRSDGTATLASLRARPRAGVFHVSWFLGGTDVPVMCPEASTFGALPGRVDPSGNLLFWPGAQVVASYWAEDGPFLNGCPGSGDWARVTASTDRPVTGLHDPWRDHFSLEGLFHATVEGEGVDIHLRLDGHYSNRPPHAVIGIDDPAVPEWLNQGGCPLLTGINPPTAEANDPEGLRVTLLSASSDPDGTLYRSDLAIEQWFHWRGPDPGTPGTTSTFLGRGRRIGPVLFEFGPRHTVVLSTRDFHGAEDRTQCAFQVGDSTPPTVTAPPPLRIPCADFRGVTPAAHSGLADWLTQGTAEDRIDPAPAGLPPQVGGADVTPSTVFPLGTTTVTFRAYDRFHNVGQATSTVTVTARLLADLTFSLEPPVLPGSGRWIRVLPRFSFRDICGAPIRLRLISLKTNGPEDIQDLIRPLPEQQGEPAFEMLAKPLADGRARLYAVSYELTDPQGETRVVSAEVRVEPQQD